MTKNEYAFREIVMKVNCCDVYYINLLLAADCGKNLLQRLWVYRHLRKASLR